MHSFATSVYDTQMWDTNCQQRGQMALQSTKSCISLQGMPFWQGSLMT